MGWAKALIERARYLVAREDTVETREDQEHQRELAEIEQMDNIFGHYNMIR